ncbi:MAG: hypothetical protein J6X94_06410 [Lachnospiraceae bacterium]|nr:hypothetical protein [Lachnospiraceae bacterium]
MNNFSKKIRKFAIHNLTLWLIVAYAIGYVIQIVMPSFMYYLALDPYRIIHGEVWRIFTWVMIPPNYFEGAGVPSFISLMFTLLILYCCYWIGNILERTWGTVKYNIFIFSGILLTVLFAFVCFGYLCFVAGYDVVGAYEDYKTIQLTGRGLVGDAHNYLQYVYANYPVMSGMPYVWFSFSTYYINMSLYIVYGLTYPDMRVMLYFVIPFRMKWLTIIDLCYLGYLFLFGGPIIRCTVSAALINCLLFYLSNIKGKTINPYQIHRANSFKRKYRSGRNTETAGSDKAPKMRAAYRHKCAICGKTDVSDPDMEFRYCSKCAGSYEYCSVHLFKHSHVRG